MVPQLAKHFKLLFESDELSKKELLIVKSLNWLNLMNFELADVQLFEDDPF